MNKGKLIEAMNPFTDEILIVTRNEMDGESEERTFRKVEYHWEAGKIAKLVLIQDLSILGMNIRD